MIPSCGPETVPVMVLPVISTWSQVFPAADKLAGPHSGQNEIPSLWMFVITRLLMVVLEKVVPVTTGPGPKPPEAEGFRSWTQPFIPQPWRATPLRVLPPDIT